MDSKNKFWRGVMVGVLVTALVCLITVGASAGIYMFGRRVIDNQTQVQVQTEGTPSQAQEPVNFENVTKKLEQHQGGHAQYHPEYLVFTGVGGDYFGMYFPVLYVFWLDCQRTVYGAECRIYSRNHGFLQ